MTEKYLTTAELAARLRTKPETIRYWRHIGKGPRSWKPGRTVLYAIEDVEAWENEHREAADGGSALANVVDGVRYASERYGTARDESA